MSALRIAIVQQPMAWTTAENLAHILGALVTACAQGATLCLFPELALTGFHRGIREQGTPAVVAPALAQVQAACARLGIACALGAPTFGEAGAVFNSYLLIDVAGRLVSTFSKNGLTPAEATFCAPGTERSVARFADRRCGTVMCREIDDLEQIAVQWRDEPVDLIFWPSMVGSPPGTKDSDGAPLADPGYFKGAGVLARRLRAPVVQSNWPQALNTPGASHLGESRVYDASGEILLQLPRDEAGIGIFGLGERAFRWMPLAA